MVEGSRSGWRRKGSGERTVLNIAHRGASADFPENTLAAFAAAIRAGADMCELDVQKTSDSALVVIHDETVDRTTDGHGRVDALTLASIKRLDAGRWCDAQFADETIPTLQEVFVLTTGLCGLNIELKAKGVAEQVCGMIREHAAEGTAMVSSFDWAELAEVRRLAPAIRIGLLADRALARLLDTAERMTAWAINPDRKLVAPRLCVTAHRRGLQVYTWTVDAPDEMRRLIGAGVDGIMTNHPERLRAVLET
ncbi:MAG TPA: glycerophosphodiester phosphodiesterase family protein [Candidatus Binataceae bacterium]|nr:glycerophosphodiester phosphodiesterase family protein [Candidatus Binataceae bacterium]